MRSAELSAAPDVGWPDCFNSGVFVFVPSAGTYQALLDFAATVGSFDGLRYTRQPCRHTAQAGTRAC